MTPDPWPDGLWAEWAGLCAVLKVYGWGPPMIHVRLAVVTELDGERWAVAVPLGSLYRTRTGWRPIADALRALDVGGRPPERLPPATN